jgi:hypothetical protein
MRLLPFLPRRKKDVARSMSLCDHTQSRRIFHGWPRGATALHLNKNYLQAVPAPTARVRFPRDLCGLPVDQLRRRTQHRTFRGT